MKRLIQNIILLVLASMLVAGILWARSRKADELCRRVKVEIVNSDSTQFVTEQGVMGELAQSGIKVVGKPMWQINAARIEEVLGKSEYLENVECVKARDGQLLIRASQLVPVMRVFDGDGVSYYVNAAGKRMNASAFYHSDVPVVQGHFTQRFPPTRLLPLVSYVEHDSLLRTLVTMYTVRDSNNVFLVPSIYGHVVNMGPVEDIENKFEKLKLFYREVMPAKGWETYDTISVKWSHQVVATRRKKAVKEVMTYDPEDDEVIPDLETMGVDENNATLAVEPKKTKKK
ncbi:MAG: hypothetical protein J6I72_02745 [Muribaculaceae bacterium]|nr:hypothetical protein [Muribaculaceae bacterium]